MSESKNQKTNKVARLFKLAPDLDAKLRKESKKENLTMTRIVEQALRDYLAVKH